MKKYEKIGAFLTDCDNTVVNSKFFPLRLYPFIARVLRHPRRKDEVQKIEKSLGIPWKQFLNTVWPGMTEEAFDKVYDKLGLSKIPVPVIGEAKDTLELFKKKSGLIGVISNRTNKTLVSTLKKAGIDISMFDIVQGCDGHTYCKPDSRVFGPVFSKMGEMNISGKIIYVGDMPEDFQSTIGTEVEFWAVTTGTTDRKKFIREGVSKNRILESINGLPKVLGII